MVKLNDFVDELFGAVGGWIELYGDHAWHLVLEDFDEVNTCVWAYDDFLFQTCWLDLVQVSHSFEAFPDDDL